MVKYTSGVVSTRSSPLVVIVTPIGGGKFSASFEGGAVLVEASATPFLDSCRALVGLGVQPDRVAVMRHQGSAIDALSAPIGVAATLTVEDTNNGVRFRRWKAPQSSEGSSPVRSPSPAATGHKAGPVIASVRGVS